MGGYGNPLVGSGWNQPGANPSQPVTAPLNLPNFGGGTNFWGGGGGTWGNPGNFQNPAGAKEISRNVGLNNIIAGQMKNLLAPQYAQAMSRYAGQAGQDVNSAENFFRQLMTAGSPFYRQRQTEGFNQGVLQNQNAGAQARQQINAAGYGYAPSGLQAATAGGLAQQGSQNLAEQYLQNLFQNEQLMTQGAQGMDTTAALQSQLAGLFNPSSLLGGTSVGSDPFGPVTPNAFQNFASLMQGLRGGYSSGGTSVNVGGP